MSQVKQIKEATDIIQILGERLQLQRAGSNWRALCPFHSEKSPSFFVSQQFQRYKCFGCGENGDVFTFLEKYEGMTFSESLNYLADRAGIKLEQFKPSHEDELRQRLLEINHVAKEYYHYLLTEHEAGQPARAYLRSRGVSAESIKLFQLGYALPAWDGLIAYLHQKKNYALEDLVKVGLVISGKGGRYYDRFRNRLMFPLTNHRGQIVGFSGRVLDPKVKEAKYINTPETLLYHKSEMLYGYSELYQEIRKKKEIIVVEGELDVISSAQAHVNNIVAIKGSALTTQHLQLITRVADKVLFSLDMDAAGIAATKRAIQLAQQVAVEMRVITLSAGKDPDELARTKPAEWRQAVKNSISVYEYLLQAALKQHNPDQAEGKRALIDELAPIIGTISHAVEQDVYVKKLAAVLKVKEDLVWQDITRFKQATPGRNRWESRAVSTEKSQADENRSLPETGRQQKLEVYILYLLLTSTGKDLVSKAKKLSAIDLKTAGAQTLVKKLSQWEADAELTQFVRQLPEDLRQLFFEYSTNPEFDYIDRNAVNRETEWQQTLTDLQQETIKQKIHQINQELEKLDELEMLTPDQEKRQSQLLAEIVSIRQSAAFKNET